MKTISKIAAAAISSALVLSGTAGVTNAKTTGKSHACGTTHVAKKSVGKKGAAKKAAKPCVVKKGKKAKKLIRLKKLRSPNLPQKGAPHKAEHPFYLIERI